MRCCAARPGSGKRGRGGPPKSPSQVRAEQAGGYQVSAHHDFKPKAQRRAGGKPPSTTRHAPAAVRAVRFDSDSDSDDEFHSADEDFVPAGGSVGGPVPQKRGGERNAGKGASAGLVDYGVGRAGQCVIGGRWVDAGPTINATEGYRVTKDTVWDQPDPREVNPLTEDEAADGAMLAERVGEQLYRSLPADLQLAFVRDVYRNYEGCGWKQEEAIPNAVEVMRNAARWRAEIDAENLFNTPDLPREDLFRQYGQHAFSGQDKWGHPRIWATVTGWPPIKQEIVDNFTQEEVMKMHTKRFLEFQDKKRRISQELQRTVILHCCILAFEPTTALSIKNAKWFNAACQFVGGPRDDGKEPESYTTDQWFFPMSLNAPAIVVNVPWKWRAAYKMAKAFMVEETANKFQLLDGNFLPNLRDLGIPYEEIPPWMLELHTGPPLKW